MEKQKSELMMQATLMQQAGPSHVVQMPSHYAAGNMTCHVRLCLVYPPCTCFHSLRWPFVVMIDVYLYFSSELWKAMLGLEVSYES